MTKKGTPSANDHHYVIATNSWLSTGYFFQFAKDCHLPPANNIRPDNFHPEKEKQHHLEAEHRRKQTQKRWCFLDIIIFKRSGVQISSFPLLVFQKSPDQKTRQLLVTLGISKFLMMITLGGNRRANKHATPFRGEKRKAHKTGWLEGRNQFGPEHLCKFHGHGLLWFFRCVFFEILPTVLRDMNGNESVWWTIVFVHIKT